MTVAIEGLRLQKRYQTNGATVDALQGVDITIEAGEFVAVMGPSGSGKSTLLHVLGGLDTPDGGTVSVGGRDLSSLSRTDLAAVRRRDIGFVFQFFNLVPVLTVEENVSLPAVLDGRRTAQTRDDVHRILELVGLSTKRTMLPSQLSGGEQQRVAVARALVNGPAVVMADEPTGNLDRATGGEVMALLGRLHADGQTILVVTHDPTVASAAQRVLFMRDGRLIDEATLTVPGETSAVLSRVVRLET